MAESVTVIGLQELGDNIDLFAGEMEKRIVRKASRAAGKVFEKELESRAPVFSGATDWEHAGGELRAKVDVKAYPARDAGSFIVVIGIRYEGKKAAKSRVTKWRHKGLEPSSEDPGVYVLFVEYGRPGADRPGYTGHGHTHQTAHPFIRPPFENKKGEAEQAFVDTVMAELEALKR